MDFFIKVLKFFKIEKKLLIKPQLTCKAYDELFNELEKKISPKSLKKYNSNKIKDLLSYSAISDTEVNNYKKNTVFNMLNLNQNEEIIKKRIDEINKIEQLAKEGFGNIQIAKKISVPHRTVRRTKDKLKESGVIFPVLKEKFINKYERLKDEILDLKNKNISNRKICRDLNIDKKSLQEIIIKLQNNGIYVPNSHDGETTLSNEEINYRIKIINEYKKKNETHKTIGKVLGISETTLIRFMRRFMDN